MHSFLQHIYIVLLPLIISNVLHMFVIKKNMFSWLTISISQKLFGKNKTWRGFVFVSLVNSIVLYVLDLACNFQLEHTFFIGFMLGFSYMLFELPNSYMKRKLGIQAGQQAISNRILFAFIDKMDSAFGVIFVYFLMGFISFPYALLLFIISSATHIIISQLLVQFHIKKSF